mgnify:CR=1 FL=1
MMHEMMMAAMLVFYVVTAYCLMVIAQKTGHEDKGLGIYPYSESLIDDIYCWQGVVVDPPDVYSAGELRRFYYALFGYGRGTRETGLDGASLYLLDRVPDSGIH